MSTREMMWNTTQFSLHERFTILRNQRQRQQQQQSTVQDVRRSMAAVQRQSSARNQRVLLQMERRPAVMAALKLKQKILRRVGQVRGGAGFTGRVTDRLTTPGRSVGNVGVRSLAVGLRGRTFRPQTQFSPAARNVRVAGRTRGIVRRSFQGNLPRGRNLLAMDTTPRFQSRPQFQAQNRPLLQTRRPLNRSQFQNKNQFQSPNQNQGRFQNQTRNQNRIQNQNRTQNRNQNQLQNRNQNRNQSQNRNQRRNQVQGRTGRGNNSGTQPFGKGRGNARAAGQGGFKGGQRNQRNARGGRPQRGSFRRGQGRGRGRQGRQGPTLSKEELDKQLDQYMASTKSTLDKELDTYMNQSDS